VGHSVEVEEVVQAGEPHVCTLRDGLVVLVEGFWDHGQARRYVGLPG
jgi:hypothetical protein